MAKCFDCKYMCITIIGNEKGDRTIKCVFIVLKDDFKSENVWNAIRYTADTD